MPGPQRSRQEAAWRRPVSEVGDGHPGCAGVSPASTGRGPATVRMRAGHERSQDAVPRSVRERRARRKTPPGTCLAPALPATAPPPAPPTLSSTAVVTVASPPAPNALPPTGLSPPATSPRPAVASSLVAPAVRQPANRPRRGHGSSLRRAAGPPPAKPTPPAPYPAAPPAVPAPRLPAQRPRARGAGVTWRDARPWLLLQPESGRSRTSCAAPTARRSTSG